MWLDAQSNVKAEAFRRRPGKDDDGLSVFSTHDLAKTAFEKGKGVASLRIDAIENLGLELYREDDDYGLITGIPDENEQTYNLVMQLADRLAANSKFTHDPWPAGAVQF